MKMKKDEKLATLKLFKVVPSQVHILANIQMNSIKPFYLHITNISESSIALKIKINSIHSYNVKPCSAILKINEELKVEITAHCNDTIENINQTHKFLIHAKIINEKELEFKYKTNYNYINATEILKNFDEITETENYRKKIGVVFEIVKMSLLSQNQNQNPNPNINSSFNEDDRGNERKNSYTKKSENNLENFENFENDENIENNEKLEKFKNYENSENEQINNKKALQKQKSVNNNFDQNNFLQKDNNFNLNHESNNNLYSNQNSNSNSNFNFNFNFNKNENIPNPAKPNKIKLKRKQNWLDFQELEISYTKLFNEYSSKLKELQILQKEVHDCRELVLSKSIKVEESDSNSNSKTKTKRQTTLIFFLIYTLISLIVGNFISKLIHI